MGVHSDTIMESTDNHTLLAMREPPPADEVVRSLNEKIRKRDNATISSRRQSAAHCLRLARERVELAVQRAAAAGRGERTYCRDPDCAEFVDLGDYCSRHICVVSMCWHIDTTADICCADLEAFRARAKKACHAATWPAAARRWELLVLQKTIHDLLATGITYGIFGAPATCCGAGGAGCAGQALAGGYCATHLVAETKGAARARARAVAAQAAAIDELTRGRQTLLTRYRSLLEVLCGVLACVPE